MKGIGRQVSTIKIIAITHNSRPDTQILRFGPHITYINVLKNISVDCDCNAHGAKPTCDDIGILGSTDILTIDKASVDVVYALPEEQRRDIVERIESRSGLHQLEHMKTLHMGNDQYELITV